MLNLNLTNKKRFYAALGLGQVSDFGPLAARLRRANPVSRRLGPGDLHMNRKTRTRAAPAVSHVCRVNDVIRQVSAGGGRELTVEGTGVGRPMVDLLRRRSSRT